MKALLEKIRKILRSRRTRQLLTRAVSGVAAIVVFITTYALVLPAITMEQDAFCGIPEHQHTDACYEERLVCEIPESEGHHHDVSCYEKFLVCGKEVHTHSTECYKQDSSAVVSSGNGAAASTALGAFAEPDVYETGGSGYDTETVVTDSAAASQSLPEEPVQEDTVSEQAAAEGTDEANLISDDLGTEGTDEGEDISEKATENVSENVSENISDAVPDGSENGGYGLEDSGQESAEGAGEEESPVVAGEQESAAGADGSDQAADYSQDLAGTDLEVPESASSEKTEADTANQEDGGTESKDAEEDKTASDIFEDAGDETTEHVNKEDDDLSLEAGDSLDMNEGSVSGSDALDISDTQGTSDISDTSDHTAEDTAGVQAEDAAPAAGTEEAANDATTNVLPEPVETENLSSGYVPNLDSIEFGAVLNKHTDFYYFHPEEGQELPASSAEVTDWKKVKNGLFGKTKLESTDLVKMYLSYTIPAGALNETNQVARYRLPSNIHLTDDQIIAINNTENGMSALYVDAAVKEDESASDEVDENTADGEGDEAHAEEPEADNLENDNPEEDNLEDADAASGTDVGDAWNTPETDEEDAGTASGTDEEEGTDIEADSNTPEPAQDENAANYQKYLGAEAIEGTRRPDQKLKEGTQEYISAIVKAENVFDEEGLYGEKGAFLGQDLIFIFTPYSIEKNQTIYNTDGDPLSAGEKITGWFACDFNMSQIDWVEEDTDLDNSTVEKTAEVVFVEKDSEKKIKEISRTLRLVDVTEGQSDTANGGETAVAAETVAAVASTNEAAKDTEDGPFKSGTLTADGDGYRITLDYTEEAKIPENAELSVREITAETDREAYELCLEQAGQQVAADEKTSVDKKASRFFDIEILVKDADSEGKEETRKIEPAAPVSVNIQILDNPVAEDDIVSMDKENGQSEPAVLHFAEEGVEQLDSSVKTSEEQDDNEVGSGSEKTEPATEITFEAESFSIYGVVYTVDFHYDMEGKTYDFSIPGGGYTSLRQAVEAMGITDDADAFVDDINSVASSAPDALWVGKVEEETSVRALKETNELEVRYSAELTVKELSQINAQTVEAGDWALISVCPFEDTETLTISMKSGDTFEIRIFGNASTDLKTQYTNEDDNIVVTAITPVGALPEGTKIHVRLIDPFATSAAEDADEEMSLYADSLSMVSNMLLQEGRTLCEAKVVDISFTDTDGHEIEPEGDVDVSLILDEALQASGGEDTRINLVHIPSEAETTSEADSQALENVQGEADTKSAKSGNELETLEADIEGREVVFTSDAFSIYVAFSSSTVTTQDTQPVNLDIGWMRFGGNMQARSALPDGQFNYDGYWNYGQYGGYKTPNQEGWWRWLRVNVYELNASASEDTDYKDTSKYTLLKTYSYLAGDTNIALEAYDFNKRDVLYATFYPAYRNYHNTYDAKGGTNICIDYGGVEAYHSVHYYNQWYNVGYWEADPNVLNIYLSREKEIERPSRTEYVIRYYHSDGSYDTESGNLTSGQTLTIKKDDKILSNAETYSGLTVVAGHEALSSVNTASGIATISYNADVPLVKLNIYYKEKAYINTAGSVSGNYDAETVSGEKKYKTSEVGLYTDKTAEVVTDSDNAALNDGRTFNLTLETWNVGTSGADVGMVLDASGSMTWSSSVPTALQVTDTTLPTGNLSNWLTLTQVNSILDKTRSDNSSMGYNGYTYYIQDPANGNEYIPLGYYDANDSYDTSKHITFAKTFDSGVTAAQKTGWYYVNTSNAKNYKAGSPKQLANWSRATSSDNENGYLWEYDPETNKENRTNTRVKNDGKSTATSFYINNGELWAVWTRSSSENIPKVYQSKVFIKPNDSVVKDEALQNAIARFAAILNANSPQSQIAMTRFSRNSSSDTEGFTNDELALLNWNNSTVTITSTMNQLYGTNPSTTSFVSQTDSNGGKPLDVYNYGFTGQTSTKRGLEAFMEKLTTGASYTPNATNTNNSKYLIIFTDGKDTDENTDWTYNSSNDTVSKISGENNTAIDRATELKDQDYTIFTVLMRSGSMSGDDVKKATAFLKELSGKKDSTTAQKSDYFFNIAYDDASALVTAFETIAKQIGNPLEGYMVRDYIDPRFDLLDADGNVITRLSSAGVWLPRATYTADGKRAMLKYDTDKRMFYLEIENQTIPTTPKNSTNVSVNTTMLTVRAKEDFIGGNDILTNGNEDGENMVFKPVDDYDIQANSPTATNTNTNYPSKDFPKTTTNPATLNITLANYEDTIFLGEDISPASLYSAVQSKRDVDVDYRNRYFDYLIRAGKKLQDDPDYYVNLLKYAAVPAGATQNDPSKDKAGNPIESFVFTKNTTGVITLTLPYYYLKAVDETQDDGYYIRSYAGGDLHQADKVGTITYTWKALDTGNHTLTDDNALLDYKSTTLDTVRYQLTVSYTPDVFDGTKVIIDANGNITGDSITNNGSVRTQTLTGQYGKANLIKDPVGTAAQKQETDTDTQGFSVIHVVAGKFKVIKRIQISEENWTKLVTKAGANGLTFTFQLKKDGSDYGQPFTINTNTAVKTVNDSYIELSSDWIDNLPKGNYTVEETGQPDGFSFMSVSIVAVTADDADSSRTGGTPFAAPTTGAATWEIGAVDNGVPAATTYAATDFSAAKVKDANKEVDPEKEKAYLNAQIGKGIVLNDPPKATDITLKKVDSTTGESIGGAKFALINNSKYVDLGAFTITKLASTEENPVVETITVGSNTNVKVVSVPKGGIKIEGLTDGTYILKEMVAPAGYVITNNGVEFTTENGSLKNHTDAEEGINFKVENEPGAALPNTGGLGTTMIYLIGIMLTGLAVVGLMMRQRRKTA